MIKKIAKLFRPKTREDKVGCYMTIDSNTKEPVYVGESRNIPKRLEEHKKKKQHGKYKYTMYNPANEKVKIFSMPNSTEKERKIKEEELIKEYHPKRNKRTYKHFSQKKQPISDALLGIKAKLAGLFGW